MNMLLNKSKDQYWYWLVRENLVTREIKQIDEKLQSSLKKVSDDSTAGLLARKAKLEYLQQCPPLTDIFTDEQITDGLDYLCGCLNIDENMDKTWNKFKNGTRSVPSKDLIPTVQILIPGSALERERGPSGLFSILESKTLVEALAEIARELFIVLEASKIEFGNDIELMELTEALSNRIKLAMFGGSIKLLNIIESIIDYLFPNNNWDQFATVVTASAQNIEEFEPESVLQPKYLKVETIAPIVIGFGFFRAKFFDEIHYLSKVCYQEQYLKLLHVKYLIKEQNWLFESRNKREDVDLTSNVREESILKNLFLQAYAMAHPTCFADAFREKQ